MQSAIQFLLNGRNVQAGCSPNTTLLEWLRGAGLTGSKEGCAEGDCGACSVAMVDRDSKGRVCYRSINSCLVPLCLMQGREIVTVEGIARHGQLHPVQQRMISCHGSQCGYCTPGFVVSMLEGYYRSDTRTEDQLDDQLCGNLCRCTGYRAIRQAATEAWPPPMSDRSDSSDRKKDPLAERLKQAPPELATADYQFGGERFLRPTSLRELLRLRQQFPQARLIAGATELGLDITKRFKKFTTLISLEAVPDLREITYSDNEWRIGTAVTLTEIEEKMADEFPALADMLRVFGSRQIRNRATMGGNLVTASPIGDSAPVLLALDASVVLTSLRCERAVPFSEFFVAYRKTALEADEILKTIVVPRASMAASRKSAADFESRDGGGLIPHARDRYHTSEARSFCRWYKVSRRREMDISTVAACFAVELGEEGIVRQARLAYGGVAAMPSRALQTEQALTGKPWTRQTVELVRPILAQEFTPISDVRGSADYRRGLITGLFERFFSETQSPKRHSQLNNETIAHSAGNSKLETRNSRPFPPHESAHIHVTGEAIYTDDQTAGKHMLEVWPVCSPHARAKILKRDASAALSRPGIKAVLLAEDVPGTNNVGAVKRDEILLADKEISYHGQIVGLVVGETLEACRAAAEKVVVEYEPLAPILTLEQAQAKRSFHNAPNFIRRGKVGDALRNSPMTLAGSFELGGQEHFYLETQAAWAEPGEDGSMFVSSSTQHPSEIQTVVAHMLDQSVAKVVVQCLRMGGGFGGKETQAAIPAALAALAACQTGRAVRVRFNRDQDMIITGHRHPFLARFKVGFDAEGHLLAARIHLYSNGGWSQDLSQAVTDRALFHLDNAYYIPAVEFRGQVAKTNLSSNTAFRGFGGPQGMLVIEEIIARVARRLGIPPETVRERNLYRGKGKTNTTHYGQRLGDNRLQTIWHKLKKISDLELRRNEITGWNSQHPHRKRGLAMTPVKFGISFTVSHLNQAGAFVLIYQDGTVQVNHGGTEMGQGVHTNIVEIAAAELGVKPEAIRIMPTSTDKVPNTSATAASCGTDLNGAAVQNACEILRKRLEPVAKALLWARLGNQVADRLGAGTARPRSAAKGASRGDRSSPPLSSSSLIFDDGLVYHRNHPNAAIRFKEVVCAAYLQRISLSAAGYYATPKIHWDRAAGRGRPFHYFAYGAAVSEVEVDGFTGMMQVLRTDILHDAGESINEGVNRGQIEGGFIQGMGWLTTEELKWDDQGRLLTHSPDTYKIPSIGDTPRIFKVSLLDDAGQKGVVFGSKAVGEPPLMLAISVREAIREAISAFGPPGGKVQLASPATCEAIFNAVQATRKVGKIERRPSARSKPAEDRNRTPFLEIQSSISPVLGSSAAIE